MRLITPFRLLRKQLPAPLQNRYVAALVLFSAWMIFFDRHDVITQAKLVNTVREKEEELKDLDRKIAESRQGLQDFQENMEKYAREQHLMHRPNEDVYLIEEQ
jgi:cell division protein FtsB